jgi:hypothetical protein
MISGLLKVLSLELFGHEIGVLLVKGRDLGTEDHEVCLVCAAN